MWVCDALFLALGPLYELGYWGPSTVLGLVSLSLASQCLMIITPMGRAGALKL
jgi:hypothetical protein